MNFRLASFWFLLVSRFPLFFEVDMNTLKETHAPSVMFVVLPAGGGNPERVVFATSFPDFACVINRDSPPAVKDLRRCGLPGAVDQAADAGARGPAAVSPGPADGIPGRPGGA